MFDWFVSLVGFLLMFLVGVLLAPWCVRAGSYVFWSCFAIFDRYMNWVMAL